MSDLHGSAPDKAPTALLLVDVINPCDFEGAEELLAHARPMARRLAALKGRCRRAGVPTIYVNDNFGRWRSDFDRLLREVLDERCPGHEVARPLAPAEDDYFVLKPKHSGFYSTTLELLLRAMRTRRVLVAGLQTHICVLFTANDAYMRELELVIPRDCSASERREDHEAALRLMEEVLKADTRPADAWTVEALR